MDKASRDPKECLNCGHQVSGNYCQNCGQKTGTRKFDLNYLSNELVHLVDFDRGFFHTLYLLVRNPGLHIREYIQGRRIGFSNPFKLFVILGMVTTWLAIRYQIFSGVSMDYLPVSDQEGYTLYSTRYFSFFSFTGILVFSLASWLIFKNSGYNFIEHIVLNVYIAAGQFLVLIIMMLPLVVFRGDETRIMYGILNFGYNVWGIVTFLGKPNAKTILLALVAVIAPAIISYYYNFAIYILSPQGFWQFLDQLIN